MQSLDIQQAKPSLFETNDLNWTFYIFENFSYFSIFSSLSRFTISSKVQNCYIKLNGGIPAQRPHWGVKAEFQSVTQSSGPASWPKSSLYWPNHVLKVRRWTTAASMFKYSLIFLHLFLFVLDSKSFSMYLYITIEKTHIRPVPTQLTMQTSRHLMWEWHATLTKKFQMLTWLPTCVRSHAHI